MFAGRKFAALLFDMDGTVVNSIAAAERVWADWARRQDLDVAAFLPTIHGVRAIETIARLALPGVDPMREADALLQAEVADIDGILPIAGAAAFLASLPPDRWAIVTSAPRELAVLRIAAAGIPLPATLVAAEDVSRGKPAPDCFRLAAERLGVDARDCLVFEDAPAGIAAAEAAGATVVVISATHQHPLQTPHAAIAGYEGIGVTVDDRGWIVLGAERAAA
ncbi:HAD-IA family hydrolase [Mesorhizobium muleiense]|uniref:Sugar-phosphatase n=1 Tax=Mesorhizobium muleiense TaxID=1004279 RepID=A0A1G8PVU8_9HYPH|nr:HAD-IA family hydrolase [Mesorhizobium muleiense]MCF6098450.1 HAD-IA family hydrolase [Mesorhizobium muleiense]SDI96601.1 sugar-phosphatase [Mesorhizobium muleiense]